MAPLGRAALLLAFGLVAYALIAGSYAAWKRRRRLALSAQNALLAAFPTVEDPDSIKKEVAELRGKPLNFDYIGLALLTLVMACWEVTLSKGQEWD